MLRIFAVAMLVALPSFAWSQQPEFLQPYGPPVNPFSPVVRVGNMLYLAGQMGTSADTKGGLVPGGIQAETRAAMMNIKDVLEKSGSDMNHVVKCSVFLADLTEWPAMNEVYRTFFKDGKYPARSAFGAAGLVRNGRVEIECIATMK